MPSSKCPCNIKSVCAYRHTPHNAQESERKSSTNKKRQTKKCTKHQQHFIYEREKKREKHTLASTHHDCPYNTHLPCVCIYIFGPVFARHEIKFNRLAECSSRDNTHSAYHNEKPKITLNYYCTRAAAAAAAAAFSTSSILASTLASAHAYVCDASLCRQCDFCVCVYSNYCGDKCVQIGYTLTHPFVLNHFDNTLIHTTQSRYN